jgi:hypothetical protein
MTKKRLDETTQRLRKMERAIVSSADFSLAVFGMGFVRNGSGQFLNIRAVEEPQKKKRNGTRSVAGLRRART